MSKYLEDRPGGADSLIEIGEQNAAVAFEDVGHSADAPRSMGNVLLGRLEGAPEDGDVDNGKLPMARPNVKPGDSQFKSKHRSITAAAAVVLMNV